MLKGKAKTTGAKADAAKLKKEINKLMAAEERDWEAIDAAREKLSAIWDEYGKDGELPE